MIPELVTKQRYFQSVSVRKDVDCAIDVSTQCENPSLPQAFKMTAILSEGRTF
jgi:hypothetical protein